jgi:hypothetical protein
MDKEWDTPNQKLSGFMKAVTESDRCHAYPARPQSMDLLCSFTDLALTLNSGIPGKKDAQPVKGRIRVLSKT